jgi:hypothetical protein
LTRIEISVHSFHEHWQVAYDTYLDLSQQYKADEARMTGSARAKWSSLRMHALARVLDCHLKLQLPVTRTFTMLGLEFLKVFAETVETEANGSRERPSAEVETAKKIVQLWQDITHDASGPGKPIDGGLESLHLTGRPAQTWKSWNTRCLTCPWRTLRPRL